MLNVLKNAALGCALLASVNSLSCDIDGKTGFMPENDMYISADQKADNGMTKETFDAIIDRALETYRPIVAEKGANLVVVRNWTDGTVNAYANQVGNTWNVHMFGGFARHELVSNDGFALVICHELGHHLAGAPKVTRFFFPSWASNEGQSDYWAAMKCFKRIYESDDNESIVSNMEIDAEVVKKCEATYSSASDVAMCKRVAQASKGLAQLLNSGREVSFTTPDTSVVRKTDHKHPRGQCRLDTYFQGALCIKDYNEETSNSNQTTGVCNRSENFDVGVRPLCWFKPSSR